MTMKRLHIDTSCSTDEEKTNETTSNGKYKENSEGCEEETLLDSEDNKHETDNGQAVTYEGNDFKAPDGGWGWFVVLGAFLTHVILGLIATEQTVATLIRSLFMSPLILVFTVCIGGVMRSSGVIYLQLLDRFDKSATATSWVLALCSTLTLVMGPVVSALSSRFSIRFVVYLGGACATVGLLISAFSPSLTFLYFSFSLLSGLGRSLAYSPCLVMVNHYFNKRRGLATGLATCGGGVGSFLFPPMIEKLFDFYGFTGTFLVLAAINSHFFVNGSLYRSLELHRRLTNMDRKTSQSKRITHLNNTSNTSSDKTTCIDKQLNLLVANTKPELTTLTQSTNGQPRRASYINRRLSEFKLAIKKTTPGNEKPKRTRMFDVSLFRNYAFVALIIQIFLFSASFGGTFVFLPALALTKGLTKIEGAYLVAMIGISDALSRVLMSAFLDLKKVKKFRLMIYNIMMFSVGVVSGTIPLMRTFGHFAATSLLYGLVTGTVVSQKSVVLVDILGVEKLSSSFGLLLMFQGIGILIGPVVGALFKDFMGSYEMSFYFGSIGIIIGAIILASGNVWLHIQRKKTKQRTAADV